MSKLRGVQELGKKISGLRSNLSKRGGDTSQEKKIIGGGRVFFLWGTRKHLERDGKRRAVIQKKVDIGARNRKKEKRTKEKEKKDRSGVISRGARGKEVREENDLEQKGRKRQGKNKCGEKGGEEGLDAFSYYSRREWGHN